ncbi:MAG: hypothetical protein JWQ35_848, partial [Bacteriovoracaceae bacterium]|nr:hypothetical protein [Bacteriovoracaceae bacterium]
MFQIQIRTLLSVFTIAALGHDYYSVDAAPLDPSGYSLYSSNGDVTLNNLTQVSIGGNVRSEISTCTFNNISSLSIIGSVVCSGNIKFNNLSGSVTGVIHSLSGVTVSKGFSTGGTTVVNSISPLLLGQTSAPVGSLDPNYVLPITIVTGDYDVNGSVTLSGTIFATGDIHINNGSSISGSGALVAAGAVHLNNVSSVGTSGAQFFIYALGSGGIDTNNISSLAIKGTLYAPNGAVKLNNIGTVNISG